MSDSVRDLVLEYMRSHNTMTICTHGEDGPWATALFYVNDGFTLYFLSDPKTIHCRNIAANPTVAATINEDYRDWREIKGIQLQGTAEMIGGRREKAVAFALYVKKYPFVRDFFSSPAGITRAMFSKVTSTTFYRLKPQRLLYLDNKQKFGYRVEIPLDDASMN
ncbi:MAG: pyridoxamine 5'-phosphate oxidase family protein [Chloroflexi bacterium]|nr:pyridoxamine 5'-phosphate oxidase family protein [Chloroflexota bacterium]